MNRMTCNAVVLMCLVMPTLRVHAQKAAPVAQTEVKTTMLVYDIRDLCSAAAGPAEESTLIPATRIGARKGRAEGGGGGGGGGGGAFGGAKAVDQQRTDQLVQDITNLIKESIDRESWIDNGGSVGSAKYLNGMLVIVQSAVNQARIGDLLKQLRAESTKMVRIRATWVPLSQADLDLVLVKDKAGKAVSPLQEVDPAALEDLIKQRPATRGQITCFNGQSVSLASGRARSIILDVEGFAGNSGIGYNPIVQTVRDGVELQVTPTISPEADSVTVHLASVYSEWPAGTARVTAATTRPVADATNPSAVAVAGLEMVDRIDMLVQDFKTTVRIPAGRMVLISGATLAHGAAGTRTEQVFLILEATPVK